MILTADPDQAAPLEDVAPVGDGKRRVVLVGFSPSSMTDAPFGDPAYEIWGMNNLHNVLGDDFCEQHFARWFELHPLDWVKANRDKWENDHLGWLRSWPKPLFMADQYAEIPRAVRYPLEHIQERMRTVWGSPEVEYINSTFVFQIMLALDEGVDEISIYGADMVKDSEYGNQRPNLEYWIGVARQQEAPHGGRVGVRVAERCSLLRGPGLYAYQDHTTRFVPPSFERYVMRRAGEVNGAVTERQAKLEDAKRDYWLAKGAQSEVATLADRLADAKRGADL